MLSVFVLFNIDVQDIFPSAVSFLLFIPTSEICPQYFRAIIL